MNLESLISIMYKICSHIATTRIYNWAERESKIDEAQAGFRKGYSAVDNIFLSNLWLKHIFLKKGGRFYCLYLDFSKAFDSLIHEKSSIKCVTRILCLIWYGY